MTFPRIVSEFNGVTSIATGYCYPSAWSNGPEFRPLALVVVQVATRNAERELERLREEAFE